MATTSTALATATTPPSSSPNKTKVNCKLVLFRYVLLINERKYGSVFVPGQPTSVLKKKKLIRKYIKCYQEQVTPPLCQLSRKV